MGKIILEDFVSWTDINECSSNPCENDATCNDLVASYSCACAAGYTGERCETGLLVKELYYDGFLSGNVDIIKLLSVFAS